MKKIGIDMLYSTKHIYWGDISVLIVVPMEHLSQNKSRRKLFRNTKLLKTEGQETFSTEILESKYKSAGLEEATNLQEKMTPKQEGKFYMS